MWFFSSIAAATTVCPSGCDRTSLYGALSAGAGQGTQTIEILAPGTYNAAGIDALADDVTIVGRVEGVVLVNAWVETVGSALTLQNVTVQGTNGTRFMDVFAGTTLTVLDSEIRTFSTPSVDSAFANLWGGHLVVRDSWVHDLTATDGALAQFGNGSTVVVERSLICGNRAWANGGVLHRQPTGGSIVFSRNTVIANQASTGGVYADDGMSTNPDPKTIERNTFVANVADPHAGGVLAMDHTTSLLGDGYNLFLRSEGDAVRIADGTQPANPLSDTGLFFGTLGHPWHLGTVGYSAPDPAIASSDCDPHLMVPAAAAQDWGALVDRVGAWADGDGDGRMAIWDCDDTDAGVSDQATEVCNGKDDDCDGQVDEGCGSSTFYADTDGDGYGDPGNTVTGTAVPDGYVTDMTDCDDSNPAVHPGAPDACNGVDENCSGDESDATGGSTWYDDDDSDGYGDPGQSQQACTQPSGWVAQGGDCDDTDAAVRPNAVETCDGVDTNCANGESDATDRQSLYVDADLDGYGAGASTFACPGTGLTTNNTDCDDANTERHPGAVETCDGIDTNCANGEADAIDRQTFYEDQDGDGWGSTVTQLACTAPAGWVAILGDCNDTAPAVHPDAIETCDGTDTNCAGGEADAVDATTFYVDSDHDGHGGPTEQAACVQVLGLSTTNDDCDDAEPTTSPSEAEVCNDGVDNDCDGETDTDAANVPWYPDVDGDGWGDATATPIDACEAPSPGYVSRGQDCDDGDDTIFPGADELCTPLGGVPVDEDCDGQIDTDAVDRVVLFPDLDGDGAGAGIATLVCPGPGAALDGSDCDDNDPDVFPLQFDGCDGIDTNCNGILDEDGLVLAYEDLDLDGWGTTGVVVGCVLPAGMADQAGDCDDTDPAIHPEADEVCDLFDNDCDDAIDDDDPDGVTGSGVRTSWADLDADGWGAGPALLTCDVPAGRVEQDGDCDDEEADVSPGAPEVCNGRDDDCDRLVDEDAVDAVTGYPDGDGDGVSSPDPLSTCDPLFGLSAEPGDDCDDDDPERFPGATEIPGNGIDEDCDGADLAISTVDLGLACRTASPSFSPWLWLRRR